MHKYFGVRRQGALRRVCFILTFLSPVAVFAQTEQHLQIQQLLQSGQNEQALIAAENAISAAPRDPQLRFLKARAQMSLQQTQEAQETLEQLIAQYPELPEPYNNLAVLKAAQGQLLQAQTLLNQAIQNQPDYAQAYENLADVQVRLALENLRKAQAIETSAVRQKKMDAIEAAIRPAVNP